MPICVAVSDPLPIYRQGMLATLAAAGYAAEAAGDLLDWAQQEYRLVVMLTLWTPADWAVLERLRDERPAVVVVAVLPEADPHAYVRAVAAGATSAVPRDAAPETVRRIVEDVLRGISSLPAEAVAALAAPHERPTHMPEPSPPERDWLRELAVGATVAQLAERSGYSERAMFRLLRELYARLGVRNRTEALMLAQRRGWL
jgi:DNA-binding NarL/FixJ family response regulator